MVIDFLLFHGILNTMLSRKIQKVWCFYFCLWHFIICWYLKFIYSCFRKRGMGGGSSACNYPSHPTVMRSQMFSKIGVLKNFATFTGNHPCWNRLQHRCFSVNIAKFLRTVFYRTRLVAFSERINGKDKRHDFWSY